MLMHLRDAAGAFVLRFPFTIAATLLGAALVLALKPELMRTAGTAGALADVSAPPAPALMDQAATARAARAGPAILLSDTVSADAAASAAALEQWSEALTLMVALTGRPNQAAHDLAR